MLTKISITVDMDNVLDEVLKLLVVVKEDHSLLNKYFADLATSMEDLNVVESETSLRHFVLDCHELQEQLTMVMTRLSDIKEIVAGYTAAKFVTEKTQDEPVRDEDSTPLLDFLLDENQPYTYSQEQEAVFKQEAELLKSIEELGYD